MFASASNQDGGKKSLAYFRAIRNKFLPQHLRPLLLSAFTAFVILQTPQLRTHLLQTQGNHEPRSSLFQISPRQYTCALRIVLLHSDRDGRRVMHLGSFSGNELRHDATLCV
jgi:hypothetical protein